jgi:regulator of sigma E protease
MSGFLIAVLSVGVILGFMILIHEFGHYATAKLLGVRVEVFSIGFGKRLFGFRRGDTDYRIAAIPLGVMGDRLTRPRLIAAGPGGA